MHKELKLYRNGLGEFELVSYQEISGRHILMEYTSKSELELGVDDAVWFLEDKANGRADHILVVEQLDVHGNPILRRSDEGFLNELRDFKEGEVFTLVATYRNIEHESK